jgi:hypothetical protein
VGTDGREVARRDRPPTASSGGWSVNGGSGGGSESRGSASGGSGAATYGGKTAADTAANDLTFEDLDMEDMSMSAAPTVHGHGGGGGGSSGGSKFGSSQFASRPITPQEAADLREMFHGDQNGLWNDAWRKQNFSFNPIEPLSYGIVQHEGGSCGVVACVQGCVPKRPPPAIWFKRCSGA